MLPKLALLYIPALVLAIDAHWPDVEPRSALAAQIEQETCPSLRHSKCWNPKAELKTSREYGFGLGQITVTSRFNVFEESKALHPSLSGWKWEDRYNAEYQLRVLVLKNRANYSRLKFAANNWQRMAFTFAAYNGGLGGVLQDRKLCSRTAGCDPSVWFDHVEKTSLKARTTVSGYGKSFFDINREYVRNVLYVRRPKYVPALDPSNGAQ